MPRKKTAGRNISSFKANVTASLRIMNKNSTVNGNSLIYEVAITTAGLAYNHVLNPLYGFVHSSLFPAADSASQSIEPIIEMPLSIEEIKLRQTATEKDSIILNQQLKYIESKICLLIKEKKIIDKNEKDIRTKNCAVKGQNNKLPAKTLRHRLEILALIDDLLVEKIELLPNLIREHATRRVDLMFLLMISVYKKNLKIVKGRTERQHGKGSKKTGTAACHASLIPHPVFEELEKTQLSNLKSLIPSSLYGFFTDKSINKSNSTNKTDCQFLKGCYLEDVLNITDELPTIVNDFDCHMEGKWGSSNTVKAAVKIINLVSIGKLTPIEGMNDFGRVMSMFFSHMQYKYVDKDIEYKANSSVLYPKAFAKVWRYQQQGTLPMYNIATKSIKSGSEQRHIEATLKSDYIYLMLNLQQLSTASRLTRFVYKGAVENKILAIQEEILSSPSEFDAKLTL